MGTTKNTIRLSRCDNCERVERMSAIVRISGWKALTVCASCAHNLEACFRDARITDIAR